jgi:hypothetical protein
MTNQDWLDLDKSVRITVAALEHKRRLLGERPRDPAEQNYARELDTLIADLKAEGLMHQRGIPTWQWNEVGWIAAKQSLRAIESGHGSQIAVPGLARIQRELDALSAADARERERQERWPTPDTRHPYRYTGPRFKTLWDGDRHLEPGDVVQLTEAQAAAFADRFEAVEMVKAS